MSEHNARIDRREFLRTTAGGLAIAGVSGALPLSGSAAETSAPASKDLIRRNENPDFVYRRLGRTNFNCGRVVAGWIKEPSILRKLISGGVNYLDTARGYGNYEVELSDLLSRIRDKVWLTSKATGIAGFNTIDAEVQNLYRRAMSEFLGDRVEIEMSPGQIAPIDPGKAEREKFLAVHKACIRKMKATGRSPDWRPVGRRITDMYVRMLDESLERLKTDHVDCYFVHGIEIPWIFQCTELWEAFEKARKAGKVKHFGFSTHTNQKDVLAAAVEANQAGPWQIDLVMPGVNPGAESFHNYRPELEALKKQDVGIVAMKTSGQIRRAIGRREEKLAEIFEGRQLNEWERAKAYMLHATDGLIDAVIAAVDRAERVERTLDLPRIRLTEAARRKLEAMVRLEMAGSCSLCGDCTTACPEDIAVADLLRYHAYIHQYDDREMAAELYARLGYDPARRCSGCGRCSEVCPSSIDLMRAINEVVAELA